jgi:hypothetical protein
MAKIAIVRKSNLVIESIYEGPANQLAYGGPWGRPEECAHIEVPAGLDATLAKAQMNGNNIELVLDPEKEAIQINNAWAMLRAERNARLAACDYSQLPDAPMTQVQKEAWAVYRQALRDLPENTVDPRSPNWPAKPQQG